MKKTFSILICISLILLNFSGLVFVAQADGIGLALNFSAESGEEVYSVSFNGDALSATLSSTSVASTDIAGTSPIDITAYLKNGTVFYGEDFTVTVTTAEGSSSIQFNANYAGGMGLSTDPYRVATLRHLNNVSKNKSAQYLQIANIDTGSNFSSIFRQGTSGAFTGTYIGQLGQNGERKEIALNITNAIRYSSVFGSISGATIKNIKVTGTITTSEASKIDSVNYKDIGSIAGSSAGNSTIDNCENTANIFGGGSSTGGIIGSTYTNDIITNCINRGNIETNFVKAGGIVGAVLQSTASVSNCVNYGSVKSNLIIAVAAFAAATETTYNAVGGIIGWNTGAVANCVNESTAVITGEQLVGGITGYTTSGNDNINITGCINKGIVESATASDKGAAALIYIGGIAGYHLSGKILNSINDTTGTVRLRLTSGTSVTANNVLYIGGISGYTGAGRYVANCVNKGSVIGMDSGTSTAIFIGGIVGSNYGNVQNCSNLSNTLNSRQIGGIIGRHNLNAGTVSSCYNIGNLPNTAGYKGGIAARSDAAITNCFNLGEARGTHSGGIIGTIGAAAGSTTNCYSVVKGASVAPIINAVTGSPTRTNLYYVLNTGASVSNTSNGGTAKTFAELARMPAGIDSANGWTVLNESETNQFLLPQLLSNPYYGYFEMPALPVWDETNFGGGYGTSESPYIIANATHFNNINLKPNKYYIQTAPITEAITEPILGTFNETTSKYSGFSGSYDGDNYSITVNINKPNSDMVGLFGKIVGTGSIKDLTLTGSVAGNKYVGSVVGLSTGTSASSVIQNVRNYATVSANGFKSGGLVGNVSESSVLEEGAGASVIQDSINYGDVISSVDSATDYVGGICGITNGVINRCANYGKVFSKGWAGGIVGFAYNSINTSYNAGEITGEAFAGGIAAQIRSNAKSINTCYNIGTVRGINAVGIAASSAHSTATYLGGVVINYSYNAGAVIRPDGKEPIYQLNGDNAAAIKECYYLTASGYDDNDINTTAVSTPGSLAESTISGFQVYPESSIYKYPQIIGNLQSDAFEFALLTINVGSNGTAVPKNSKYVEKGATFTFDFTPSYGFMGSLSYNGSPVSENVIEPSSYTTSAINSDSVISLTFAERPATPQGDLAITTPIVAFVPVISEAETFKNQDGTFTVNPALKYGVLLSVLKDFYGWNLVEYGVVLNGVEYPALITPVNGKYGILFEGISTGSHNVKSYAKYSDGSNEITVYGETGNLSIL